MKNTKQREIIFSTRAAGTWLLVLQSVFLCQLITQMGAPLTSALCGDLLGGLLFPRTQIVAE